MGAGRFSMSELSPTAPNAQPGLRGWRRLARPALYGLGIVLVGAAIAAANRADGPAVWPLVRQATVWQWCALLLIPIGNWLLTSGLFSTLTGHFGRVDRGEMAALIGASWLLNYLPLQPGLLGRIAYHHRFHGIAVRHSLVVIGCSMGCTVMAAAIMVAVTVGTTQGGLGGWLTPMLVGCGVLLVLTGVVIRLVRPGMFAGRLALALGLRYADMGLAAIRYGVLFAMLGHPIRDSQGSMLAATSLVATLPPVPMGLREWAVELLSRSASMAPATAGLRVDLLGRAGEVSVALVVGLVSAAWLYWQRQGRQRRLSVIAADNKR